MYENFFGVNKPNIRMGSFQLIVIDWTALKIAMHHLHIHQLITITCHFCTKKEENLLYLFYDTEAFKTFQFDRIFKGFFFQIVISQNIWTQKQSGLLICHVSRKTACKCFRKLHFGCVRFVYMFLHFDAHDPLLSAANFNVQLTLNLFLGFVISMKNRNWWVET